MLQMQRKQLTRLNLTCLIFKSLNAAHRCQCFLLLYCTSRVYNFQCNLHTQIVHRWGKTLAIADAQNAWAPWMFNWTGLLKRLAGSCVLLDVFVPTTNTPAWQMTCSHSDHLWISLHQTISITYNFSILFNAFRFYYSSAISIALILKSELPSRVLPAGALGGRCLHSKASKSNIRPFCKMASSKPLLQKWNLAESWSDFDSHPQHANHHHTFSTGILEAVSGPDTFGQPFSRKKRPLVPMVGCKEQKELGAMIKLSDYQCKASNSLKLSGWTILL